MQEIFVISPMKTIPILSGWLFCWSWRRPPQYYVFCRIRPTTDN